MIETDFLTQKWPKSSYKSYVIRPDLNLSTANITAEGAEAIAMALIKRNHSLWINDLNSYSLSQSQPSVFLESLDLTGNKLGNDGVRALCKVLPYTSMRRSNLLFDTQGIDLDILENCGVATSTLLSSDAHSLHNDGFYPYILLYRFYRTTRESITDIVLIQYYKLHSAEIQPESKYQHAALVNYPIHSNSKISSFQEVFRFINASNYQGSNTIIISLDANFPFQNTVDNLTNSDAVIGSFHSNNYLVGNQNTFIDISQNRGKNLLIPGKNNLLQLGFFSRDHIFIQSEQGTIKIIGFTHRDILHIFDPQTIYSDNNLSCHNINSSAILQLRGTEVKLIDIHCDSISGQIRLNNQTALEGAQAEVFQLNTPENTIFYNSLLGICETFVNSVCKSALFTAVPVFITEMVYRFGEFSRQDAEAFGQKVQVELILACSDSPHVIAASWLANCLAAQLTNSPKIVSMAGISIGIVMSVVEAMLSQNASWGWMALQMGTAMLGSAVGSVCVQKLPEFGLWSLNKLSEAKSYASNKIGFWYKKSMEDSEKQEFLICQTPFSEKISSTYSM